MFHLSSLETTNTKLAAALSAVGIPLRKNVPVRLMTGVSRGDTHCFFFEEQSPCGQFKTDELIKAWSDPEWHRQHPEHPFAYLKVSFDNMERLTDYIRKGTRTAAVTKGRKIAFLSLHAPDPVQKLVFAELNDPR
jgi:hypothetical protein